MAPNPPTEKERSDIDVRLENLIDAITEHPQWVPPPNQNPTLYHIWDFVNRSKYILSEYDSIKAGRVIQHPNQFKNGAGKGEAAAVRSFQDVCSRTMTLEMLVSDPRQAAMITGNRGTPVDFGKRIKDAVEELKKVCPEEHVMAGFMN